MTALVLVVLLLVLLVVAGAGVFAFALAQSSKKKLAANAQIPGVDVAVPASWAGSHDPEARLHRRVRDAVAALDATIATTSAAQIDDRARLMVSAQELDQRLVSIWSLPRETKAGPLAQVEAGVAALEAGARSVVLAPGDGAVGRAQDTAASIEKYSRPPRAPSVPDITPAEPRHRPESPEPPSSLTE